MMNKQLSFRARALDTTKAMPVFKAEEIPELPDFAAINRSVPQMPTGMEKEEETEHHLQRALTAQQVYGTAERLVIPIPEVDAITAHYLQLYKISTDYKPPKQFIHVQPWGMDQEIPDYDMDSEDEQWMTKQSKNFKNLSLSPLKFENMMDRLEKGSGQTVVTLHEAKALLKEDDDLTIAVYDYWLNKRLRLEHALIPQVKTEKRDGSTTNNPYVAFRRRTEKMQTRKNRKNDESSYERMLKLKRDLNKALTILELMKRREKSKKELLKLTIEILEKRYQMNDYDAKSLQEALAQRHKLPSLIPIQNQYLHRDWGHKDDVGYVKKKREYKKRKHKHSISQQTLPSRPQLPHYTEVLPIEPAFSSEDEIPSPQLSVSEHEEEDPDGIYAFRRKEGCSYHQPLSEGLGDWPWCSSTEGGAGEKHYRYSLASLNQPRHCVGFVRRRMGRGGRVILDRGYTDWDDYLTELDLTNRNTDESSGWDKEYMSHINRSGINHFRPNSPIEDVPSFGNWGQFGGDHINPAFRDSLSPPRSLEFNVESFQDHQEELLQMQRQQQEQLLKQETDLIDDSNNLFGLDQSFSSLTATSRFTLDSATAQFAASAVCSTAENISKLNPVSVSILSKPSIVTSVVTTSKPCVQLPTHSQALTELMMQATASARSPTLHIGAISSVPSTSVSAVISNGPINSKTCGLSTSPAASILQLNYPLHSTPSTSSTITVTTTVSSTPSSNTIITSLTPLVATSAGPTLISPYRTTSLATTMSLGTLSVSIPSRLTTSKTPVTVGSLTRAVVPPPPTVLKLASAPTVVRNDNLPRENHDSVNNIAKDKIVAMEVT